MTIAQLFDDSNENSSDDLKNKFEERNIKRMIDSYIENAERNFFEKVERSIISVSKGFVKPYYYDYCSNYNNEEANKYKLSEDSIKEVFKDIKKASYDSCEKFEDYVKFIFNKKETKKEATVVSAQETSDASGSEAPVAESVNDYEDCLKKVSGMMKGLMKMYDAKTIKFALESIFGNNIRENIYENYENYDACVLMIKDFIKKLRVNYDINTIKKAFNNSMKRNKGYFGY